MIKDVIGLDCGASHSTLAVWDGSGHLVDTHELPGINLDLINRPEAEDSIRGELLKMANYPEAYWVVGIAGLDNKAEVYEADKWLRNLLEHTLPYSGLSTMSDVELVLWSGSQKGVGVGLIAGTGSNCFGRNSAGLTRKTGGVSHVLSDEGGGFSLGWRCLHLVTKMADGREEKTNLLSEVLGLYGQTDMIGLKNFLLGSKDIKALVSRSAPLLLKASTRGEASAGKIVAEESLELVRMVAVVNDFLQEELPLFIAGSLFKDKDYLDLLSASLRRYFPKQKMVSVSPINGSLNYARSLQ